VPIENGSCRYVYPLALDSEAASTVQGDFTLTMKIRSGHPITGVESTTHKIAVIHKKSVVVVGLEEMQARLDRDFELRFAPKSEELGLAVTAQRDQAGDGTFLVLLTPGSEEDEAVLEQDVVLVMDTSGSMEGEKIAKAKAAMRSFVSALRPGDRFNILTFCDDIVRMRERLVPIDPDSRQEAVRFIDAVSAGGGTAIDTALRTALADAAATPREGDRVRPLRVIFVSDGNPTVGERDPKKITRNAVAANEGNARIFAFGVESQIDGVLLNLLAAKTGGSAERVHSGSNLDSAIGNLLARVSQPVFSDISVTVEGAGAHKLFPTRPRDLFAGGQVELVGRYLQGGPLTVAVTGTYRGATIEIEGHFDLPENAPGNGALCRLWAKRRIAFLQDEIWWNGDSAELTHEIIHLSKTHRVLTPYTAMLILEKDEDYRRHGLEPPPRKAGVAKANGGSTEPVAWSDGGAAPGRIDVAGGATPPSPAPRTRPSGPTSGAARGGAYRGPGESVPPGLPQGPTTPATGGPVTPGPGGGPVTPGGAAGGPGESSGMPGPGAARGGKKRSAGEGLEQWQYWWDANQDAQLELAARLGSTIVQSGSTGFLTGMGRKAVVPLSRPPSAADVKTVVVPTLKGVLAAEDLDIVDSALLALARSVPRESASLVFDDIRAALGSGQPVVLRSAILSLGVLGSPDAVPILSEIMRNTEEGRRLIGSRDHVRDLDRAFAAVSLGNIGAPESIDTLMDVIRASDTTLVNLRASAILALGLYAERQDEIVSFLFEQLANAGMEREARAQIPIALSRLGKAAEPAIPELLTLLRARKADVLLQESCVIALGRLAEPANAPVLEALYETIQYGRDSQARHFAFDALARIGARAARDIRAHDAVLKQMLRFLRQELERPKHRPHSPWASLALAKIGREYPETSGARVDLTLEIIRTFEDSDNPSYKAAYAVSLGLLNARSAGSLLFQELLDTPDPNLRGYLAVALGMIRYTEALPTLRQMVLDSRAPRAQLQGLTALGLMGDAETLPLLLDGLRQAKTRDVISSLAKAIGKIGDKNAIPTLKGMIEDESLPGLSRAYCCAALGLISEKTGSSWTTRITDGVNYRTALPFLYELMDML